MSYSILISKKELARILGVSSSTVSRWTREKHLPEPFPLGPNSTKWVKEEIEQWIEERKANRGFYGHKPERGEKNVNKTQ